MDVLAPIEALDRYQRRHAGLALPVAVFKKFGDDQAGNLSALIAYYGFFSLFSVVAGFVTVLGFVLAGNPDAQAAVLDSALKQIPLVGSQIQAGSLHGIAVSLALNGLLFFVAFRLLTDASVSTRQLWPGIVAATVLWTVPQAVGGAYIGHVVQGAGQTYGTFATVIGLLTWLFLGARIVVYSAEASSTRSRPRGPAVQPRDAIRRRTRWLTTPQAVEG